MRLKQFNSPEHYPMLKEARLARFQPPLIAQLGIFILIFIAAQILAAVPTVIAMVPAMMKVLIPAVESGSTTPDLATEDIIGSLGNEVMLVSLFATASLILLSFIYCRLIEKRSFASMGFYKQKFIIHYLSGLFAGAALFAVTVLICLLSGAVSIEAAGSISAGYILLFFLAFLVQGMSEEVLCRGYFLVSLTNRNSVLLAVIMNSLLFSLLHFFNPNVTFLALFNIFLFGAFCSLYMLYFNNIWGVCALHSAWNFVQGNIFGSNVSGMTFGSRLLNMSPLAGYDWLSGGTFGIEGGIAMTIVLAAGIVMFVSLLLKRVVEQ